MKRGPRRPRDQSLAAGFLPKERSPKTAITLGQRRQRKISTVFS